MAYSLLQERQLPVPASKTGQTGPNGVPGRKKGICRVIGDPAAFIVALKAEMARMRRYDDSSCLMFFGTDALIQTESLDVLARRVAANLRSYDVLCRYGANHFLILLPRAKTVDVAGIARRVRVQAAGYALTLADGGEGFVTASTGGVMLDPDIGMQKNIDRAAKAFGAAQRDGGNSHRTWTPAARQAQPILPAGIDA